MASAFRVVTNFWSRSENKKISKDSSSSVASIHCFSIKDPQALTESPGNTAYHSWHPFQHTWDKKALESSTFHLLLIEYKTSGFTLISSISKISLLISLHFVHFKLNFPSVLIELSVFCLDSTCKWLHFTCQTQQWLFLYHRQILICLRTKSTKHTYICTCNASGYMHVVVCLGRRQVLYTVHV